VFGEGSLRAYPGSMRMGSFLFVCTAFAPKNVIGSVRPTKIAKYLVRAGHDVTVVMPELPPD